MPTITQYKTGIDLVIDGTEGTDFAIERPCHDVYLGDRQTIYIKDSVPIGFAHNSRNVSRPSGQSGYVVGENDGIIRYKVDRDLHWGPQWYTVSDSDPALLPEYTADFAFEDLEYATGVPVVGTTGPNSGTLPTNATKSSFYWRGIEDSVGDEWHTITVADDDRFSTTDAEWRASDGKVLYFVVNPKTPCLTVAATGNAQFYTTPAKKYFVPVIYDQTTYFNAGTGTVTFTLRDINGNNVFYRIVSDPEDAVTSYTDAGASSVTLDQDDFTATRYLQYYFAGNAAFTKTRVVVKNPSFPSAGETHGDITWGASSEWDKSAIRLQRDPYLPKITYDKAQRTGQTAWDTSDALAGGRYVSNTAGNNALYAKLYGLSAKRAPEAAKTYAQYAKEMLMHSVGTIDWVGMEMGHAQVTIPSREVKYRGYWDADQTEQCALAYDILIDIFKSTDAAGGITAIEDYIIRDQMGRYCNEQAFSMCNLDPTNSATPRAGMWDTCHRIGAMYCAMVMPTYSSQIFGVSGYDGVSVATGEWNPFPATAATWFDLWGDESAEITSFPNLQTGSVGIEYLYSADGHWVDRLAYAGDELMGRQVALGVNLIYRNTELTLPNFEAGLLRCVNGTIMGLQDNSGPEFFPMCGCLNDFFPAAALIGIPAMQELDPSALRSETNSMNYVGTWAYPFYDDTAASADVAAPVIAPPGGIFEIAQEVTILCETPDSTIYYTTDGSTPDNTDAEYTAPLELAANTTLKAIAEAAELDPSPVTTAGFTIDTSGRPAPPSNLTLIP